MEEESGMRELTYHIYLDDNEYRRIIEALLVLKNKLIQQGRYTDAVDDVLCKVVKAKKKRMKIEYI